MTSPDSDPTLNLEDAVVARLRAEGLVRSGRPAMSWGWFGALLLGVGGLLAMNLWSPQPQAASANLYVVALYAGPDNRQPSGKEVEEHGQWAGAHQTGAAQVMRGGEVSEPIAELGQTGVARPKLVGVFTVRAKSAADAVRLARSTPHLHYGGSVVVYRTPYKG